jgi:UDP-N-acetylglucosamine acyltransferase
MIHATAVIGEGVELGERVSVGPNAVILGPATIEDDCWIGPGCVIGVPPEIYTVPQNRAWGGELDHKGVWIGPRTVVRELTTIHQGSVAPTKVGADCWLLNRTYVAHDCQIGDRVTLSAGTTLGGHVQIGDAAILGMNTVVHQSRVIGPGVMVGMGTAVTKDIPPFSKAYGSPVRLHGVNAVGMTRSGIAESAVDVLKDAYAEGRVPGNDALPDALTEAFAWWEKAGPVKSLV